MFALAVSHEGGTNEADIIQAPPQRTYGRAHDGSQPDMNGGVGGWWNCPYIDKSSTYLLSEALEERFLGSRYDTARERLTLQFVKTMPEASASARAIIEEWACRAALPVPNTDPPRPRFVETISGR